SGPARMHLGPTVSKGPLQVLCRWLRPQLQGGPRDLLLALVIPLQPSPTAVPVSMFPTSPRPAGGDDPILIAYTEPELCRPTQITTLMGTQVPLSEIDPSS
ncbi:hypothetical protein NDU88_009892, partial [Pleurodeles waltl]